MRFMIIVKATKLSEAGVAGEQALYDEMARYHEELANAGMLIEGAGLQPSSKGWRVRYDGEKRTVVDGPFAETKELVAGYTIIRAQSREEAIEWTKRFPNPTHDGDPCEIEVRRIFELEDHDQVDVERFRRLQQRQRTNSDGGLRSVTPHLVCAGASEAITFYKRAFGAEELMCLPGPEGKIAHAHLRIGDSDVMVADEFPEWGSLGPKSLKGTPVSIHLQVKDVDAFVAHAVDAGAQIKMPIQDMFWGDRYGMLEDPFGHWWAVATHVRDVSEDEMRAGALRGCADAQEGG